MKNNIKIKSYVDSRYNLSKLLLCFSLCFFLLSHITNSYANPIRGHLNSWINFLDVGHLSNSNKKWLYFADIQNRLRTRDPVFQQLLLRGAIGYQVSSPVSVWLGYVWTARKNLKGLVGHENRAFQQVSWDAIVHPTWILDFITRIEERQFIEFNSWAYRIREQIRLILPKLITSQYPLIISEEPFFNFNHPFWVSSRVFAENRFFIGTSIPLTKKVSLIIGYMNRLRLGRKRNNIEHILSFTFII